MTGCLDTLKVGQHAVQRLHLCMSEREVCHLHSNRDKICPRVLEKLMGVVQQVRSFIMRRGNYYAATSCFSLKQESAPGKVGHSIRKFHD